jgi:hypothetical protein
MARQSQALRKPQKQLASRAARKVDKKSKHFEPASEEEESSYEETDEEPSSESEDDDYESEDEPPKKKSKSTPTKKVTPKKATPQEATPKKGPSRRQSKKEDSDEEPWETFIPKEASPDAGDVEYADTKVHPNTLRFLKGRISDVRADGRLGREQRPRVVLVA